MMENRIGYAVITVEEYKKIIEDIKDKEELIKAGVKIDFGHESVEML